MATVTGEETVAIERLSAEAVRSLLEPHDPPCLSLYLPTHRTVPGNAVDRPAFCHLVESLELSLAAIRSPAVIERVLHPFRLLAADARFWQHTQDGLAVLAAGGRARVFLLQRPVAALAVAQPRFHTMPLLRAVSAMERFDVVAVTSRSARAWEGCVWHDPRAAVAERLDPLRLVALPGGEPTEQLTRFEVTTAETAEPHRVKHGMGPAGRGATAFVHGGFGGRRDDDDCDTEIFLRHVDAVVHEQVSRPGGLPLVLVAQARLAAMFRGLSKNPLLVEECVDLDPHLLGPADLAAAVVPVFVRTRAARVARHLRTFARARERGRGAGDITDVARAAAAGQVATLLVEADRFETGRLDRVTGGVEFDGRAGADRSLTGREPAVEREDVIGALAETVFLKGGCVVSLPRIEMPTESGVAAIYRYA